MRQSSGKTFRKALSRMEARSSVTDGSTLGESSVQGLLPFEAELANRFASLKVLLGFATVLVVVVDQTVPRDNRVGAFQQALLAAIVFCLYTIVSCAVLKGDLVSVRAYRVWTPPLDVIFATYLISTTKGQYSPFVQCLTLALVGTVLSPLLVTSILTTLLALGGLALIAAEPISNSKGLGTFAGRTILFFAVAVLMRFVSALLVRYAHHLTLSSRFGAEMATLSNRSEATKRFQHTLDEIPSAGRFKVVLTDAGQEENQHPAIGTFDRVWPLQAGDRVFGFCIREGKLPPSSSEAWLIGDLCERFSTFLQRTALSDKLIAASVREERLRLADELHDGYLQTLAAIGFSTEAAKTVLARDSAALPALEDISKFASEGVLRTRTFLRHAANRPLGGLEMLRAEFSARWRNSWAIEAPELIDMTEGEWRAARIFVREGAANARRHAQALNLKLIISYEQDKLMLRLFADGKEPSRGISFGYGLNRLSAVAAEHSGKLFLSPSGHGGSVLTLVFPRHHGHSSPPC
ncbi:hypothetical protein EON82_11235 [bacterium]|nr:MAG: hypothetical protein EON82_11235 [bacterium]